MLQVFTYESLTPSIIRFDRLLKFLYPYLIISRRFLGAYSLQASRDKDLPVDVLMGNGLELLKTLMMKYLDVN